MSRVLSSSVVLLALVAAAAPAQAQGHGFSFTIGYFAPTGEDGRPEGDVWNANRCFDVDFLCEPLLFDVGDFGNATFSGEYLLGLGDKLEVGLGVGFYQKTVASIYELVTRPDGSEIEQDLKLRVVPLTATLKWVPTGRTSTFQPYLGAGFAALNWRYSEVGEFVDPVDSTIFRDTFEADGTEPGALLFGGVRAPVGANFMLGGEVRYQIAEADLPEDEFLGDRLDLGGWNFQANFSWLF